MRLILHHQAMTHSTRFDLFPIMPFLDTGQHQTIYLVLQLMMALEVPPDMINYICFTPIKNDLQTHYYEDFSLYLILNKKNRKINLKYSQDRSLSFSIYKVDSEYFIVFHHLCNHLNFFISFSCLKSIKFLSIQIIEMFDLTPIFHNYHFFKEYLFYLYSLQLRRKS